MQDIIEKEQLQYCA